MSRQYKCKVYTVDEVSNKVWKDTSLVNVAGELLVYHSEINDFVTIENSNKNNIVPIQYREYKDKLFFKGIWYKGGRGCKYCDDRICGLKGNYFDDVRK